MSWPYTPPIPNSGSHEAEYDAVQSSECAPQSSRAPTSPPQSSAVGTPGQREGVVRVAAGLKCDPGRPAGEGSAN